MDKLLQLLARNRGIANHAGPLVALDAANAEATVYLYDYIVRTKAEAEWFGGVAAEVVAKELRAITASTIHLRINSPGGDVFGAQTIAQALRDSKARVIAHVDGMAASAATVVAIAADEVEIAPGGMFMVHRAWSIAIGNTNDMLESAALLDKVDGTLAAQYAARTGEDVAAMLEVMDAETWMTAEEAVDARFVDRIAEVQEAKAVAKWDLSAYAKAPPAAAAPVPAASQEPQLQSEEHRVRQEQRMARMRLGAPA